MCNNRVIAGIFGGITAIFLAGVITCFVLLVEYRKTSPEHLCHMTPGDCWDKLRDGGVKATYNVNVTVDNCANWITVEMWHWERSCAQMKRVGVLMSDYGRWNMGGVICHVEKDDPCTWDRGNFSDDIDLPLIAVGVMMAICSVVAFIVMCIYLCYICCDEESCCIHGYCP